MSCYYFVFCKNDILLERKPDGSYTIPYGEVPPTNICHDTNIMFVELPTDKYEAKTYCIEEPITGNPQYEMCGLRASYYKLNEKFYKLAGKCAELLYWDRNTKYCGSCGAYTVMNTPISKKCMKCGKEIWPQLATAIIVLVHKGNEILLVHARNFKGNFHGLVAGFVETGETLEEAVVREVREETGLKINNIKYFGSQPWPYPCGLMIGFNADYVEGIIKLQESELTSGTWYTRDNLPQIPEPLSIARKLIDNWLDNG